MEGWQSPNLRPDSNNLQPRGAPKFGKFHSEKDPKKHSARKMCDKQQCNPLGRLYHTVKGKKVVSSETKL